MVMLGKMPEVANYDLSSLKLIIVGAAPLGNLIDDLQIKLWLIIYYKVTTAPLLPTFSKAHAIFVIKSVL